MNTVYFMENHKEPKPTEQDTAHEPIMTNRENKIYNMVHTWCDEQAQDIPDQNRRYLMDAIVGMIDPQQDEPSEGIEVANTDLKKAIEDVRYLQPMINSFLTMGEQDSLNTVIESAEKKALRIGSVSKLFIAVTYIIYIIIWEALIIGGFGYVVFGLNRSGWWMLLAVLLSASVYKPESWRKLF